MIMQSATRSRNLSLPQRDKALDGVVMIIPGIAARARGDPGVRAPGQWLGTVAPAGSTAGAKGGTAAAGCGARAARQDRR